MCGIAGWLSKEGRVDHIAFESMTDIISYRGPDDRGIWYSDTEDVALGHRRLSIIDLSAAGHQPFIYGDYVLAYNGEIYNYIELRNELVSYNIVFKTQTDTEVVAAAYSVWGEACVNHFNGMWAFVIYDIRQRKAFCSRDRFGVKPLYYTNTKKAFLIASEIKQLFEYPGMPAKANRDHLMQYLVYARQEYSDETFFSGIYQLRGGYNLIYDLDSDYYEVKKYYSIDHTKENKEEYSLACNRFAELFKEAVHLRLRADVPVGYCLSGGLDSSAIVMQANQLIDENGGIIEQHAISACYSDYEFDEQKYIDEIVRNTNVVSHKIFPDAEGLLSDIDDLIYHMDEPFGSTSIYAQYCVFREANKRGLKVMLDGQGADEQLAGYDGFFTVGYSELLRKHEYIALLREIKAERMIYGTRAYGNLVNALMRIIIPKELINYILNMQLLKQNPVFKTETIHAVMKDNEHQFKNDGRKYIMRELQENLATLLHYEDRNSMRYSIESRVPFLDYHLVNSVFAMPLNYKLRSGIRKSLMRDGLRELLPDMIRCRYDKIGFKTPMNEWIVQHKGEFKHLLRNSADSLSDYLDMEKTNRWIDEDIWIKESMNDLAWRIICAGQWIRIFDVI